MDSVRIHLMTLEKLASADVYTVVSMIATEQFAP